MAKSDRWHVKITGLPPSITLDELSQSLRLVSSRITIPNVQKQGTYYAWINEFFDEQDAEQFVDRNSSLIISGLKIKCSAVGPKRPPTPSQTLPLQPENVHPRPSSTGAEQSHGNPCKNGVQCADYDCTAKHPRGRKGKCYKGNDCENKNKCPFLHSKEDAEQSFSPENPCKNGVQCADYDCTAKHPRGRKGKCYKGNDCENKNKCPFLHSKEDAEQSFSPENPCKNGVQCADYDCTAKHPRGRKGKCYKGNDCENKNKCPFLHSKEDAEQSFSPENPCKNGVQCVDYDCTAKHPRDRKGKCYKGNDCENKNKCPFLHSKEDAKKFIELSCAKYNFLECFGKQLLDKIRKEHDIKNLKLDKNKLQLAGNTLVISNIESYLNQVLHEQTTTITNSMKKYLCLHGAGSLLQKFRNKYHVGVSFIETSAPILGATSNKQYENDRDVDQAEEEQDDDDDDDFDDAKSVASNESATFRTQPGNVNHRHADDQNVKKVTLCSDKDDSLSNATQELKNYSFTTTSLTLTQNETAYILKQSKPVQRPQHRRPPPRNSKSNEKSLQITNYLRHLVQSNNSIVQIYMNYKSGVRHVQVKGFEMHVNKAVSKIRDHLNDNVKVEVQFSISKAMAIFLQKKASYDIEKLGKTHNVMIEVFSPPFRKRVNEANNEENEENNCLKLIGSNSHMKSAQVNVENFLEGLCEKESDYPCKTWDIAKAITPTIRECLKKQTDSDDYTATGWMKHYTAPEKRETTPTITISIVGFNEDAVDDVSQQCQDIVEGYVVWVPASSEYNSICNTFFRKKSPSIEEFQEQWNTDIRLDRDTSTITIRARSKMAADDIKEALLNLGAENNPTMKRVSQFISIQQKIRRFVNQAIVSVLDEANSKRIRVDRRVPNGLTISGPADIINDLKQKIQQIMKDVQNNIVTSQLQLKSNESDLIRANQYQLATRIERETKTIIRDVQADSASFETASNNNEDTFSTLITVANNRCQMLVVQKGDITKATHVDAIVNATNGPLYHAGGVDKTIADTAGPAFDQECKQLIIKNGNLPFQAGTAVKTTAGNLPFKCVIHAIGPQYKDGNQQERPQLFASVLSSLRLAEGETYSSVAMPAISSKTYGFPLADCISIVVRAVKQFFADFPQSKLKKVILLDVDDAVCNSFVREVGRDHRNTATDDDDDDNLTIYQLSPLKAKWCWQDDSGEKLNCENDMRTIENAFQEFRTTWTPTNLVIQPDNLRDGKIVSYQIIFDPKLRQTLTPNPNILNGRLVCGQQVRIDTGYKRSIIRYPITQQQTPASIEYKPKPLDAYDVLTTTRGVPWNITGVGNNAVKQAELEIQKAIESAMVTEPFTTCLDKNLEDHKKAIKEIADRLSIQIDFRQSSPGPLEMSLKGLKPSVQEAKLQISLYAQDELKIQVDNDDDLRTPKEWGEQEEAGCKLVEILKNDPTFTRIENRMKETLNSVKVNKIERVQNVRIWSHYAFRRREIKRDLQDKPDLDIEMELFHGTRVTPPKEVYNGEYGFDMTYSTSGMWGIGAYFAKNASYSCTSYAYSLPSGERQVFLAQVLTGDVYDCPSDPKLRRPPKKNEAISGLRYNSVSGTTGGSKVYIVYENRVAYPTYLITFTC